MTKKLFQFVQVFGAVEEIDDGRMANGVRKNTIIQSFNVTFSRYAQTYPVTLTDVNNKGIRYIPNSLDIITKWCRSPGLNRGHSDFQSDALPAELPRLFANCYSNKTGGLCQVFFLPGTGPRVSGRSWRGSGGRARRQPAAVTRVGPGVKSREKEGAGDDLPPGKAR